MHVDVLQVIFDYLPDAFLVKFFQICTTIAVFDDARFWKSRALRRGYISTPADFKSKHYCETPAELYVEVLSRVDCTYGSENYDHSYHIRFPHFNPKSSCEYSSGYFS